MNKIYIEISVTNYGNGDIVCTMSQRVNNGPLETTKLDEDHANKLIWELVKAGGARSYRTNWLDRSIVYHGAYLFLPN